MRNRIQQVCDLGQSIWCDNLSHAMLESGELDRLIRLGVVGITSNPTIFMKAISAGGEYDRRLEALPDRGLSDDAAYEALVLPDIREAADKLMPVFERSRGADGFVSLEVNPRHAEDTEATVQEGRRLFRAVGRRIDPAHEHADPAPRAEAPLPERERALKHGGYGLAGADRQDISARHNRRRPGIVGRQTGNRGECACQVATVAAPGPKPTHHARRQGLGGGFHGFRMGVRVGILQALQGDTKGVGGLERRAPVEQQHPTHRHRDACQPCRSRQLHGARTDGRHVDPQLLPGLGALGEDAAPRRAAIPAAQLGDAHQHGVGAFRALDGQHSPASSHYGLPRIERSQRRSDSKPELGVGAVARRKRDGPQRTGAGQQVGRHLVRPAHAEPFGLEELHYPRQDRVVAAGKQAHELRQAREEAQVRAHGLEIGPPHGAGDHHLAAPLAAQRRHHAADLAPVHPGVREAGDVGVGLAGNADDVRPVAAPGHAFGDHQRQAAAAGQNADPIHGVGRCSVGSGRTPSPAAFPITLRRAACRCRACHRRG